MEGKFQLRKGLQVHLELLSRHKTQKLTQTVFFDMILENFFYNISFDNTQQTKSLQEASIKSTETLTDVFKLLASC